MIDRAFLVHRAYDLFVERKDRQSFDALLRGLNDQFDGSITQAEAEAIFNADYSDSKSFWKLVHGAKNKAVIPLMVMRRLYVHEDVCETMKGSPEFKRFVRDHAEIVMACREEEFEF